MAWVTWIIKYYRYAIVMVVMLVIGSYIHQYGKSHYEWGKAAGVASMQAELDKAHATMTKMEREAFEMAERHAAQMAQASKDYQALKAAREQQEKVQYVKVQKIVEKPVYRNVCFDTDGLSELNRAIRNK